ncbi:hypothetical protein AWC27_01730 [Mycobacterium szulgai]|uniref:Uncharacterized protein n=1 Tax=Mycobacterium szulgai TaxID=1787 RepID=A0A1X2EH77_MYCSZ|nr:hypothetical protein AWC27_01730 [Mycobacterium szulgai]
MRKLVEYPADVVGARAVSRSQAWRVLFKGVMIDCLGLRSAVVGCFWECSERDSARSGGDIGGYLVLNPDEFNCVAADFAGECLSLGLARCVFWGGAAASSVGDREVFFNVETGTVGVLDGIDDPALGCADRSCTGAGDARSLAQIVSFAIDDL